jgi:hypothetical protein
MMKSDRRETDVTLLVSYAALAVLAVGAAWDLSLSLFDHVPTFCTFLRRWNTGSNDLLAMVMLFSCAYLWVVYRHDYDNRVLFVACYLSALWWHLFGLFMLHLVHIQGPRT